MITVGRRGFHVYCKPAELHIRKLAGEINDEPYFAVGFVLDGGLTIYLGRYVIIAWLHRR